MGDWASNLFKVVLGLIFILVPLYLVIFPWRNTFGAAALAFVEGGITVLVILIGVALVIVGLSEL